MNAKDSGTCKLGDKCKCNVRPDLRVLCGYWSVPEQPTGELEAWCIANWNKLPEEQRKACVELLDSSVPEEVKANWRRQAAAGMRIGSEDLRFHLGVGMAVRNTLRKLLTDDKLPPVNYPDEGVKSQNWDDYYYGALDALARLPTTAAA